MQVVDDDKKICGEAVQPISPVEKYGRGVLNQRKIQIRIFRRCRNRKNIDYHQVHLWQFWPNLSSTHKLLLQPSPRLASTFCQKQYCSKIVRFVCSYGIRQDKSNEWEMDRDNRRFQSLIPSYIRDSSVAVIVYDISSRTSFNNVMKWVKDVRDQRDEVILVIVGNKTDLSDNR